MRNTGQLERAAGKEKKKVDGEEIVVIDGFNSEEGARDGILPEGGSIARGRDENSNRQAGTLEPASPLPISTRAGEAGIGDDSGVCDLIWHLKGQGSSHQPWKRSTKMLWQDIWSPCHQVQ